MRSWFFSLNAYLLSGLLLVASCGGSADGDAADNGGSGSGGGGSGGSAGGADPDGCNQVCAKVGTLACHLPEALCRETCMDYWIHCDEWQAAEECFKRLDDDYACTDLATMACRTEHVAVLKCVVPVAEEDGGRGDAGRMAPCTPGEELPYCYCNGSGGGGRLCPESGLYEPCPC